ncbi:amidohydrolase family protein [Cumulibacter manganitolerans]|uniref:amidohydrolase family protein n=1 Tax=Cumulibacter manganitolerans TaxID=1884992 RepID=UPI0012959EF4|nr:amidohydrolase family protein [Cumulibacter manganitolerans]
MGALRFTGVVLPGDEQRDLYVVDGRVSYQPVASAETVTRGGYIVPGLVDAHCHLWNSPEGFVDGADHDRLRDNARQTRDGGATLIRDCGCPYDTAWMNDEPDLPEIIRAGKHIAQDKRYITGVYTHTDAAHLPAQMAAEARRGDGWVKLVGDWIDRGAGDLAPLWGLDELRAGMTAAHAAGARVTAHTFSEAALPDLVASGIDCIEHGTGITDEVIAAMVEHGTALVPTLVNIRNFPSIADSAGKYPTYAEHMRSLYEEHPRRLRAAYEAGVPIYAGTDAGGGIAHGSIAEEVIALTGIGMSAVDALGAASWRARAWLGRPGLEEGAPADFACYSANPLDDLAVLREPRHVVLRGVVH